MSLLLDKLLIFAEKWAKKIYSYFLQKVEEKKAAEEAKKAEDAAKNAKSHEERVRVTEEFLNGK